MSSRKMLGSVAKGKPLSSISSSNWKKVKIKLKYTYFKGISILKLKAFFLRGMVFRMLHYTSSPQIL